VPLGVKVAGEDLADLAAASRNDDAERRFA